MLKRIKQIIALLLCISCVANVGATYGTDFNFEGGYAEFDETKYLTPIPGMDTVSLNYYEALFGIYKRAVGYSDNSQYLIEYNQRLDPATQLRSVLLSALTKGTLEGQWGVTDRESALLTLIRLQSNGLNNKNAWDLSRAMSNIFLYYRADYITFAEAMKLSYALANDIRLVFSSWDEFFRSYLNGYENWNGNDGSGSRRRIYEAMMSDTTSPIYLYPWDTPLVEYVE